jgi:hypothetical protein
MKKLLLSLLFVSSLALAITKLPNGHFDVSQEEAVAMDTQTVKLGQEIERLQNEVDYWKYKANEKAKDCI